MYIFFLYKAEMYITQAQLHIMHVSIDQAWNCNQTYQLEIYETRFSIHV